MLGAFFCSNYPTGTVVTALRDVPALLGALWDVTLRVRPAEQVKPGRAGRSSKCECKV